MKQRQVCLWIDLLDLNESRILFYKPFFLFDEQNGMEWVGAPKYEAALYMDPYVLGIREAKWQLMVACYL